MNEASGMAGSNPFSNAAFRNVMGGGEVDPAIKLKLRSRILDLVKEFPEMGQAQLFQSIMSVVGQILTHGSGSKVSAGNLYGKLNNGAPQGQPNNQEAMK
jgi:hypothetical protein